MVESWLLRKQVEARLIAAALSPQIEEEVISSDEMFARLGILMPGE